MGLLYLGMCHQRLTEVVYLVKAVYLIILYSHCSMHMCSDVYEGKKPNKSKVKHASGGSFFKKKVNKSYISGMMAKTKGFVLKMIIPAKRKCCVMADE